MIDWNEIHLPDFERPVPLAESTAQIQEAVEKAAQYLAVIRPGEEMMYHLRHINPRLFVIEFVADAWSVAVAVRSDEDTIRQSVDPHCKRVGGFVSEDNTCH